MTYIKTTSTIKKNHLFRWFLIVVKGYKLSNVLDFHNLLIEMSVSQYVKTSFNHFDLVFLL